MRPRRHRPNPIEMLSAPTQLRAWLVDPSSLTRRIRHACPRDFRVRLIGQRWERPPRDEAMLLGIAERRYALVREVFLLCEDEPWVYARTVFPAATLSGRHRVLGNLGSRPLGAVLFAFRGRRREIFAIERLGPRHSLHAQCVKAFGGVPRGTAWLRRTLFTLQSKPLLVNEVFLPGFGHCPPSEDVDASRDATVDTPYDCRRLTA